MRSPLAFIACFVVCGVAFPSDECWDAEHKLLLTCHDLDRQITEECYAMASFALLEAPLKRHRASDVACGILYFVRRALGVSPVWVPELTALTRASPSSAEVVLVLEAFDSLLLTSSPQDPIGEEIQGEIEREIQGEREIEREGVTEGEREIEREGVIKSEGVIEREGEKESVARVIMGTAVPQVSSSSSSSGRRAKERSEMEILLDQIASASLGTAEGRDRDRDRDQSSPGFEGQNTPEEKASRFNKAREGNVYPSPVSILAVDSLEHFLEA